jgi:hypothetical protein
MKQHLVFLAFVAISNMAIAQQKSVGVEKATGIRASTMKNGLSKKRGYIGLSLGPSFPLGDFAKKENFALGTGLTGPEKTSVGLQLNLVNLGYLFSEHVGIAAAWFGAAYNRSSNRSYELEPWSCGGIMVGPLFSFPMSEKVEWDLRAMIGPSACSGQPENGGTSPVETNSALVFNIGSMHRVHLSKKISLLLSADFFSTKLKFKDNGANWPGADEQPIRALSLGVGFAYRIK